MLRVFRLNCWLLGKNPKLTGSILEFSHRAAAPALQSLVRVVKSINFLLFGKLQ